MIEHVRQEANPVDIWKRGSRTPKDDEKRENPDLDDINIIPDAAAGPGGDHR